MNTSSPPLFCGSENPPPFRLGQNSPIRAAASQRPLALVIDDEQIIADTIAEILNMSGFESVPLYSGQAGLDQARAQCPDIVITDVVMPDLNGIEMAKQLLVCCPSTKILLVSGQAATTEMMKRARADGLIFDLLAKPLHPEDLLAVLRRLGFCRKG